MIDAHGRPQTVLVIGGTSEIGLATVRAFDQRALTRVVLAGRPSPELDEAAAELDRSGLEGVTTASVDAADTATHADFVSSVFDGGDVDVVLLVAGVLGDQAAFEADPELAVEAAQVNYVGAMSLALHVARRLGQQRHGVLVVLSSVAGERARRSNYVYGSTKAGLDAVGLGIIETLRGTGASALVVRPGFVHTKMTAHLPAAPLAVSPEEVGAAVVEGLRKRKEIVYVPQLMRPVMSALRHVPRPLFRRLPL